MLKLFTASVFSLLVANFQARADCLEYAARFASQICGEIAKTGNSSTVAGSGNIQAQTNKILSSVLGSVGGTTAATFSSDKYEGVIREQLASDRFNTLDCRQKMAQVGIEECNRASKSTQVAPAAPMQVVDTPIKRTIGRWVRDRDGEPIEITASGDVHSSTVGTGRISPSFEAGSNIGFYFQTFSCLYYASFTLSDSMILALRKGGKSCATGTYLRAK